MTGWARAAVKPLDDAPLTGRLAGLRARICIQLGERDEARAWAARGAEAPQEPDWSDLDPEGRAFVYTAADWARIVQAFAERGELAHPRFERGERGVSDLPQLPAAYAESAPFISAAETGAPTPPIVDDGDFGAELQAADLEGLEPAVPVRARRGPRGRAKSR